MMLCCVFLVGMQMFLWSAGMAIWRRFYFRLAIILFAKLLAESRPLSNVYFFKLLHTRRTRHGAHEVEHKTAIHCAPNCPDSFKTSSKSWNE